MLVAVSPFSHDCYKILSYLFFSFVLTPTREGGTPHTDTAPSAGLAWADITFGASLIFSLAVNPWIHIALSLQKHTEN